MSYDIQIITAATIGYLLGLTWNWAEMQVKRRMYKNRRRRLAKMKYA